MIVYCKEKKCLGIKDKPLADYLKLARTYNVVDKDVRSSHCAEAEAGTANFVKQTHNKKVFRRLPIFLSKVSKIDLASPVIMCVKRKPVIAVITQKNDGSVLIKGQRV